MVYREVFGETISNAGRVDVQLDESPNSDGMFIFNIRIGPNPDVQLRNNSICNEYLTKAISLGFRTLRHILPIETITSVPEMKGKRLARDRSFPLEIEK